jgi:hypothetical protein
MDDGAIGRARNRVEQRADGAALETLFTQARDQIEALTAAASALEDTLPARVEGVVREQAQPMGRNLAEIRGLMNQMLRRLERLESDFLAERHARVDDLGLLVELVSSGWQSVDARLERIEQGLQQQNRGAIVYRMEDRRPDAATS